MLVAIAYLFGKVHTLSNTNVLPAQDTNTIKNTNIVPTNIPTINPTTKTQVIYKSPTPQQTQIPQRKKVNVVIFEIGLAGSYYCYEDKANELTRKEQEIDAQRKLADWCSDDLEKCKNPLIAPAIDCPTIQECTDKTNRIIQLQDEFRGLINSYCP